MAQASCVEPLTRDGERQVILRAQGGDPECFKILYDLHRRRVFNLCLRMIQDWSRAEELTQDTFLQVYRRINTFRGDSAFTTWLHRIAVNIVLMHLRQNRARLHEVSGALPSDEDQPSPILERLGTPDGRLSSALDRVSLEHAISHLPEGYRLIFVLHDIEGYEHHEIADLLGCSVGNTKSQLHKARLKIRRYLRGEPVRKLRRRSNGLLGLPNGNGTAAKVSSVTPKPEPQPLSPAARSNGHKPRSRRAE